MGNGKKQTDFTFSLQTTDNQRILTKSRLGKNQAKLDDF